MGKKNYGKCVAGPGVAAYAYLNKADTNGKYSNGKFKVDLVLDGDTDMSKVHAAVEKAAEIEWGHVPDDLKLPYGPGRDDKEEFEGKIVLKASSKFRPTMVDAKRNELPVNVWAASGDTVKVSFGFYPYEKEDEVTVIEKVNGKNVKKKTKETTYGVSAQLRAVQLIEKNTGGGGADDFDDEEGYEAPANASHGGEDDPDDF